MSWYTTSTMKYMYNIVSNVYNYQYYSVYITYVSSTAATYCCKLSLHCKWKIHHFCHSTISAKSPIRIQFLSTNESVNLSVCIMYGFLATTELPCNNNQCTHINHSVLLCYHIWSAVHTELLIKCQYEKLAVIGYFWKPILFSVHLYLNLVFQK